MGGVLENQLILNTSTMEEFILILLLLYLFVPLYFKHQITQLFRTNAAYSQCDEVHKAWRHNIICSRYLIQMDMAWSVTKQ